MLVSTDDTLALDGTACQHKHDHNVQEMMTDTKYKHHRVACFCTVSCHCGLTACVMCRERVNLSVQLKDTKTVVGRLQWVIGLALHIIAFFIYLTIFNVSCCHAISSSLTADQQASLYMLIGSPSVNHGKAAHRNSPLQVLPAQALLA